MHEILVGLSAWASTLLTPLGFFSIPLACMAAGGLFLFLLDALIAPPEGAPSIKVNEFMFVEGAEVSPSAASRRLSRDPLVNNFLEQKRERRKNQQRHHKQNHSYQKPKRFWEMEGEGEMDFGV